MGYKYFAEICGIHAGDGYLRNDGKRRELDISGSYEEKVYYDNHIIPMINKLFNLNVKGRFFVHRHTYGFVIRDEEIIDFMHKSGFPYGAKSTIVKIPDFILEDRRLQKNFLRGYFDTDGHLGFTKRYGNYSEFEKQRHCYPRLLFTTVSKNLAKDLSEVFKNLDIDFNFNIYKPKRLTENVRNRFCISGVLGLKRWLDLIGMKNETKYSRYKIWKKFGFCPTNISYNQRLNIIKGLLNPNTFYGPMVQPG